MTSSANIYQTGSLYLLKPVSAHMPHRLQTVSIIVPTLNEEATLPRSLSMVQALDPPPHELLIADGGSSDRTVEIARRHGRRVVQSRLGRGTQIHTAVQEAQGDVLFFAHVDMTLASDCLQKIITALNHSGKTGGAVGCRFDHAHPFLSSITLLNNFRARALGIFFGDQGLFIRRDRLDFIGGFPDLPIMEDVEFSLRLRKIERPPRAGAGKKA